MGWNVGHRRLRKRETGWNPMGHGVPNLQSIFRNHITSTNVSRLRKFVQVVRDGVGEQEIEGEELGEEERRRRENRWLRLIDNRWIYRITLQHPLDQKQSRVRPRIQWSEWMVQMSGQRWVNMWWEKVKVKVQKVVVKVGESGSASSGGRIIIYCLLKRLDSKW